jgi:hypothetical protein
MTLLTLTLKLQKWNGLRLPAKGVYSKMSKRITNLVLVVFAISLFLTGCTLTASTPPPGTAVADDFPFETVPVGGLATLVGETQTAIVTTPQDLPLDTTPSATVIEVVPTATETQVPVEIPTLTRPETYTLQRGEWPICIARRYDLPLDVFLSANNMTLHSQPGVGTVLQIPSEGSWNAGARQLKPHPTTHAVASGESIYSIACQYGDVSPEGIAAANGLEAPYDLSAGQTLQIP